MRGLKFYFPINILDVISRIPRGCVDWNKKWREQNKWTLCRIPRGCVDWNWINARQLSSPRLSHPTRMRGLKSSSFPMESRKWCRIPRGCVDWNWNPFVIWSNCLMSHPTRMRGLKYLQQFLKALCKKVASHADAWIEMHVCLCTPDYVTVASHADAWIEIHLVTATGNIVSVASHADAWIEMSW